MRTWIATGSLALLVLTVLVVALPARAAQTVVTLQASDLAVPVGGTLELTVAVSGSTVGDPTLSGLRNFDVVGTSSGSSIQIVNGSIAVSHTYSYQLVANRPGSNDVTAVVRTDGGRANSNTIHLSVLAAGAATPNRAQPPAAPPDLTGKPTTGGAAGAKPIFMRAVVRPESAVVGGLVIVEYYIYIRDDLNPQHFQLSEQPQFTGFVTRELISSNTLTFATQRIGAVNYHTALVRRWALFPVAAGPAQIGSLGLVLEVPRAGRRHGLGWDPFGDLDSFFGGRQQIEVKSEPVGITVAPVPTAGRPSDWNGAVGNWRITTSLDRTEAPVGEPVELRISVSGAGNADALQRPPLALGEGLRIYSESDKSNLVPGVDDLSGEHTFSVMLIATAPGEYTVPAIRLPFYDPEQRAYRVVETGVLSFKATGQASANQPRSLGVVSRESVELRGRDLRYSRGDRGSLRRRAAPLVASPILWVALGLWPLAVFGVVLYQARLGRLRSDRGTWRSRRATKEARRRLAQLKALIRQGDAIPFFSELHRAVLNFVADKLDAAAPGLSPEELSTLLRSRGVSDEAIAELFALWRAADEVRFAGKTAAAAEREAAYVKARNLLADLSRDLEK